MDVGAPALGGRSLNLHSPLMAQQFEPGDFLVLQLESSYSLLRVLGAKTIDGENIWHLAAYRDLFIDIESAETALQQPESLSKEIAHAALTERAFESTQTAKLGNVELTKADLAPLLDWRADNQREISDRSIRLILGLR